MRPKCSLLCFDVMDVEGQLNSSLCNCLCFSPSVQARPSFVSQTSIASTLSQERREQIRKKRHYMMTIIELLLYCASQEIALRGHTEGVDSRNKGHFLELVDIISNHDSIVKDRVQFGPKNAVYTSHGIHDEILKVLGKKVVHTICERVRRQGFTAL